ncbi:hypothetical protein [Amycolatopsis sp. NPDC057786]|uniref:hypothetical protein n=1 Tax=Amycolatopsis sp. NPDC057786 TaxID=3346250 RepID=UPI00366ABE27
MEESYADMSQANRSPGKKMASHLKIVLWGGGVLDVLILLGLLIRYGFARKDDKR